MAIMTEAKSALKNGTSTLLSTARRRPKATQRFMPIKSQTLVKQMTRRFRTPETRRVPVIPLVIVAAGATVAGAMTAIILRRFLAARYAGEEGELAGQEASLDAHPDAELVKSL